MNLEDALHRTASHVALMGDPGSGKSTLAGKLATEGFNIIWFSLDGGHSVLHKLPTEAKKRIELIHLPDTRAWPVGYTTINKLFDLKKLVICDRHGSDACSVCAKVPGATTTEVDAGNIGLDTIVVIDHGSQLADSCMNTITKSQPVDYKPHLDDWGSLRFHLAALGKKIQAAPFHVLMLFQPEESKMEDGRSKITPGWGSNNSSKTASQYFDHLVYCEVYNKAHKAGSASTYSINAVAKSRTDIKIEDSKEPSLAPFFSVAGQKGRVAEDRKTATDMLASVIAVQRVPPAVQNTIDALVEGIAGVSMQEKPAPAPAKEETPVVNAAESAKSALDKLRAKMGKAK